MDRLYKRSPLVTLVAIMCLLLANTVEAGKIADLIASRESELEKLPETRLLAKHWKPDNTTDKSHF